MGFSVCTKEPKREKFRVDQGRETPRGWVIVGEEGCRSTATKTLHELLAVVVVIVLVHYCTVLRTVHSAFGERVSPPYVKVIDMDPREPWEMARFPGFNGAVVRYQSAHACTVCCIYRMRSSTPRVDNVYRS